jgi:oligopeptide/dipeptide ABC transporter ATP-binding protein
MQSEQSAGVRLDVREVRKTLTSRSGLRRTQIAALDGVSFELEPGSTLAVVGESGSGKTTLGRIVSGLLDADTGTVEVSGLPVTASRRIRRRSLRRAVQMVFQNPLRSFSPTLTIGATLSDAIALDDGIGRARRRHELGELLKQVRVDPGYLRRRPAEMSGGQLQRVGIVRALAAGPGIVVLDEPTSALDVSLHGQIVNLLVDLQRNTGIGYLLISHDLRVARAMADRILVLYLGQVVETGPASAVLDAPAHPYTQAMLDAVPGGAGGAGRRPVLLAGEVQRPAADDEGCKLRFRCPFATDGCERPQQLTELADGRQVRCWRAAAGDIPIAPAAGPPARTPKKALNRKVPGQP